MSWCPCSARSRPCSRRSSPSSSSNSGSAQDVGIMLMLVGLYVVLWAKNREDKMFAQIAVPSDTTESDIERPFLKCLVWQTRFASTTTYWTQDFLFLSWDLVIFL